MLLRQLRASEAKVENQYKRVVPWEGNRAALRVMAEAFELRPYFEWRGLGFISQSACGFATPTPSGMQSGATPCLKLASPIQNQRNAEKCSKAS